MNNSPPICSAKEPNRSSSPGRICSTASARRAPRSKLPVEIHDDDSATAAYPLAQPRSTPPAAGLERAEGAVCQGPQSASSAALHGGFTARRTFHPGGIESPARRQDCSWSSRSSLACASTSTPLILRTQDIGASLEKTILIYAGFNLVAALISYPAGSLSDRWGRRNLLLASFVIFLIAYLGFALTQNMPLIAGLFIFYGLYQGIFRAVGKAFASDFVPDALRASAIGWYSTSVGLLELVASIVAGLLWDRIGHVAVFYYGTIFALIGSIGLVLIVPE